MKIEYAVLAAGSSVRMGGVNKLSQPFKGSTVIGAVLDNLQAAGVDQLWLVHGEHWGLEEYDLPPFVRALRNPLSEQGMGSSIALVVRSLSPTTNCLLLALGDMPCIRPETIRALVSHSAQGDAHVCDANIWAPTYGRKRGHPVIFDKCWFKALANLNGDQGGAMLFEDERAKVSYLEVDDPGILLDIDTPDDLSSLSTDQY